MKHLEMSIYPSILNDEELYKASHLLYKRLVNDVKYISNMIFVDLNTFDVDDEDIYVIITYISKKKQLSKIKKKVMFFVNNVSLYKVDANMEE